MNGVNEGSWVGMIFRMNNVPDAAMKGGARYILRCAVAHDPFHLLYPPPCQTESRFDSFAISWFWPRN